MAAPGEREAAEIAAAHLANWRDVLPPFLAGGFLPPLVLNNGYVIHHGPRDTIADLFYEIFIEQAYTNSGFYTPSSGDTVLDLGANIGVFALFMCSKSPDVRVHCFEPAPENLSRLRQNIDHNHLQDRIAIQPFALLDRDGHCRLEAAQWNGQRSLYNRGSDIAEPDVVPCVSLAHAIALTGASSIELLKLDVEGAEIEILEGANDVSWNRIARITLECHEAIRPGCRERVCRVLRNHGFTLELGKENGGGFQIIRGHRP